MRRLEGCERRNYDGEMARPTTPCTLPPCLRTLRQLRQLARNNRPEDGLDLRDDFPLLGTPYYGYCWIVRSNFIDKKCLVDRQNDCRPNIEIFRASFLLEWESL